MTVSLLPGAGAAGGAAGVSSAGGVSRSITPGLLSWAAASRGSSTPDASVPPNKMSAQKWGVRRRARSRGARRRAEEIGSCRCVGIINYVSIKGRTEGKYRKNSMYFVLHALFLAAPLNLNDHLIAAFKLLEEVHGLAGRVDLFAVERLKDVAALDAKLRVDAVGAQPDQLQPVALAVLEIRGDAPLLGERLGVVNLLIEGAALDHKLGVTDFLDRLSGICQRRIIDARGFDCIGGQLPRRTARPGHRGRSRGAGGPAMGLVKEHIFGLVAALKQDAVAANFGDLDLPLDNVAHAHDHGISGGVVANHRQRELGPAGNHGPHQLHIQATQGWDIRGNRRVVNENALAPLAGLPLRAPARALFHGRRVRASEQT